MKIINSKFFNFQSLQKIRQNIGNKSKQKSDGKISKQQFSVKFRKVEKITLSKNQNICEIIMSITQACKCHSEKPYQKTQ